MASGGFQVDFFLLKRCRCRSNENKPLIFRWNITSSLPCQFVDLPFCRHAISSTSHLVKLAFFKFAVLLICQFEQTISSTSYFNDVPFCQFNIWSTFHFANLPFCQQIIVPTYHFINLPFRQLAILPTCHFFN